MAISGAKLEANRRNSQKSCGPVTEAGKNRSKRNAVKHGMRAATLELLDEDALALDDRKADWTASPLPRGAAEQRIVDDAVEYSWLRDSARRAQEARLATNIVNAGVDEANREADEVLRLGQKFFSDNRGPLANYPHYDREADWYPENVPLVSESEIVDGDTEAPQRLVLRLQATAGGCQWMLDRWSELRSKSACVASTWLAAGAGHARSTQCSSCAAARNLVSVRRLIWLVRRPLRMRRSKRAQRQMGRTNSAMALWERGRY